jgi:hypothetical protein
VFDEFKAMGIITETQDLTIDVILLIGVHIWGIFQKKKSY